MSAPDFKRLEDLLLNSSRETLSESEQAELNALLRDHAEARAFAARFLTLDALLAETLAAQDAQREHKAVSPTASPVVFRPTPTPATWLAKAAAWFVGFRVFSDTANTATAATTAAQGTSLFTQTTLLILMKKTITSVTAALLMVGGTSLFVIHQYNQKSEERLATMETEIKALSEQLGVKRQSSITAASSSGTKTADAPKLKGAAEMIAIFSQNSRSMKQGRLMQEAIDQLKSMNVESLTNLLLDAEKLSNPIPGHLASLALREMTGKDPAQATKLSTQLIGSGNGFQFQMSHAVARAFKAWLAKDPAAADAWYVATAGANGFDSKGVPPSGLDDLDINRSLARLRFTTQVVSNPAVAESMLGVMLAGDVVKAMKEVNDPGAVALILPKLSPDQRGPAAEGVINSLAANDLDAAFTWAKSLGMDTRQRDTLLASAIESASSNRKLDLAGVAEWSKKLDLEPKRRSDLQVSAALNASLVPAENRTAVAWDRVSDGCDWLRQQAPEGMAAEQLGAYLGRLAYESHNPDKFFEVFEKEAARHGPPNLDLTISFTSRLIMVEGDSVQAESIKLLKKFPAGEKRDDAIRLIEINR